jgi:hypothetical protein
MGQWNLILKGLTGSSTDLSTSYNDTFRASNVNKKITAAGGTGLKDDSSYSYYYWSSTEHDAYYAWLVYISGGRTYSSAKDYYSGSFRGGGRTVFAF